MKLTLRDLFWLVLVVAMALGWLSHYWTMQRKLEAADRAARKVVVTELALRSLGFVMDDRETLRPWK